MNVRFCKVQFSCRTAICAIGILAIPCAWFASCRREFCRENAVVTSLNSFSPDVGWFSLAPAWVDSTVHSDAADDDPEELYTDRTSPVCRETEGHWSSFLRVSRFIIDGSNSPPFHDNDLDGVLTLPYLDELSIAGTDVTDRGVLAISAKMSLQTIWLNGTHVSDSGMAGLGQLCMLHALYLDNTHVTDSGVQSLLALNELRILSLSENLGITDATVARVQRSFPHLRELNLTATSATAAAVKELRRVRPGINVRL